MHFIYNETVGALVLCGIDPENPPKAIHGVTCIIGEIDGMHVAFVDSGLIPPELGDACFNLAGRVKPAKSPAKKIRDMCGNLECILGMRGLKKCPRRSKLPEFASDIAYRQQPTPEAVERLAETLRRDGVTEYHATLPFRERYTDMLESGWAAAAAQSIVDDRPQDYAWAFTYKRPEDRKYSLDAEKLEQRQKLVLDALEAIKEGRDPAADEDEW